MDCQNGLTNADSKTVIIVFRINREQLGKMGLKKMGTVLGQELGGVKTKIKATWHRENKGMTEKSKMDGILRSSANCKKSLRDPRTSVIDSKS